MHGCLPVGLGTLYVDRSGSDLLSHDPRGPDPLLRKMLFLALRTLET